MLYRMYPRLPEHLQPKLNLPGRVGLGGDYAECAGCDACVRAAESRRVERVEEFGTELNPHSFHNREVLEKGKVEVPHSIDADVRHTCSQIPERECSRLAVNGLVKIGIEPFMHFAIQFSASAIVVRQGIGGE